MSKGEGVNKRNVYSQAYRLTESLREYRIKRGLSCIEGSCHSGKVAE